MGRPIRGGGRTAITVAAAASFLACSGAERATKQIFKSSVVSEWQGSVFVTRDTAAEPACTDCTIEIDAIASFGSMEDPILLRRFPLLVRDSRGVIYAVPHNDYDHEIVSYGPDGKQIQAIGGFGDGPGEYKSIDALAVGPADTLLVAHDSDRLTLFTPSGEFARTVRTPYFSGSRVSGTIFRTDAGTFVRAGVTAADSAEPRPLHVLSEEGVHLKGFGGPGIMTGTPARFMVYPGRAGTAWIAEPTNYVIEQLDAQGNRLRILGVASPYMPTFLSVAALDSTRASAKRIPPLTQLYREMPRNLPHPPIPELAGVVDNPQEGLLIAIRRPADEWEDVEIVWHARDADHVSPAEENKQLLYVTQIDVVDVRSGRLEARTAIPGYASLLNDGTLARMSYGPDGVIGIELFDLVLRR